ncbi:MAG: hypothetical protein FJZ05_00340 [Candidatus Nealsonbacteria bacterium]|nr:hypothetical protein [Candidatus Nealsonbacteria bacterium]
MKNTNLKNSKAFTFVDILIGISLMLIIFISIFGVFQLASKVIALSKNKIAASSVANEEIEKIRNLAYSSVGIIDGVLPTASGTLSSTGTTTLNNVTYFVERKIEYISDEADGIGGADSCDLDYKRVEIAVSWQGRFSGSVKMVTDISPQSKDEELASCQSQP